MPNAEEITAAFVQGAQFDIQAFGRSHSAEETCALINGIITQINYAIPATCSQITAIKVNNPLTNSFCESGTPEAPGSTTVTPSAKPKHRKPRKTLTDRQRSTARKLEMLQVLMASAGKVSLNRIMRKLERLGLATAKDRGTVITQLSRMKEDDLLKSDQIGYYESTPEGSQHLKNYAQLRKDLMGEVDDDDDGDDTDED